MHCSRRNTDTGPSYFMYGQPIEKVSSEKKKKKEEEEFIFHIITNNMQCNYCKINIDNVEGYRKSRGHQSRLPHYVKHV